MSLASAVPAPLHPFPPQNSNRHLIPADHIIQKIAVLGGLHHEYSLNKAA
jgi:putative transposase